MLAVSAEIARAAAGRPLDGQGWRQAGELALALVLAASIGLEREIRQKNAGLRTHTLVGVGAALFVLISKYGFTDVLEPGLIVLDPSRMAAQIVSGVGFLGAGLIFVRRDSVRGLTGEPLPFGLDEPGPETLSFVPVTCRPTAAAADGGRGGAHGPGPADPYAARDVSRVVPPPWRVLRSGCCFPGRSPVLGGIDESRCCGDQPLQPRDLLRLLRDLRLQLRVLRPQPHVRPLKRGNHIRRIRPITHIATTSQHPYTASPSVQTGTITQASVAFNTRPATGAGCLPGRTSP